MTRSTSSNATRPTIVLKTVLDDIAKQSKLDLDAKKVRARLRATPSMREIHTHNASWIFTPAQYDAVRSMFDPAYAKKIAKPARAPRAKKIVAPAPVVDDAQS